MDPKSYSTQKHVGIMYFVDVAAAQQRQEAILRRQQKKQQREQEKLQREQLRLPRSPARDDLKVALGHTRDGSSSSAEQREAANSAKRSSFFSLRSKNPAVTTRESVDGWPSSNFDGTDAAVRKASPTEEFAPALDIESQNSWSLFGRGRRPKGASTRNRSPSPAEADDESGPKDKERPLKQSRASSSVGELGARIASPFGFHHGTRPGQDERQVADSSKGRVLKKAHTYTVAAPPEAMQSKLAQREARPKRRPPPLRPKRSDERLEEALASAPLPQLKSMRSADNFTQPTWSQVGSPSGIITPPPRNPARVSLSPTMIHPSFREPSPRSPPPNEPYLPPPPPPVQESDFSGDWDKLIPIYDSRQQLGNWEQALPSPRFAPPTAALPQLPPATVPLPQATFSGPLEKVIEEPEGFPSPRQSIIPKRPSVRHSKSTPSIKTIATMKSAPAMPNRSPVQMTKRSPVHMAKANEAANVSPVTDRPMSLCSETLGIAHQSIMSKASTCCETPFRASRDVLTQACTLEFAWEDDIDFCYNNAAEANCEFDWNDPARAARSNAQCHGPWMPKKKTARHGAKCSLDSVSSAEDHTQYQGRSFYHGNQQVSVDSTPDLGYVSASSASVGPRTPRYQNAFSPELLYNPDVTLTTPQLGPLTLKENGTLSIYNPLERQRSFETKPLPAITPVHSRLRNASFNEASKPRMPPTSAPTSAPATAMTRQRSASASQTRPAITLDSIVSRLRASPVNSPISPSSPYDAQFVWDRAIIPSAISNSHDRMVDNLPLRPSTSHSNLTRSDSSSTITTAIRLSPSKLITPPQTPASSGATPTIQTENLVILPAMTYSPTAASKASTLPHLSAKHQSGSAGHSPPPTPSTVQKARVQLTSPVSPDIPPPVPAKDAHHIRKISIPGLETSNIWPLHFPSPPQSHHYHHLQQQQRPTSPRRVAPAAPAIRTNVGRQSYSLFPSPISKQAASPVLGPGAFVPPFGVAQQHQQQRAAMEKMARVITN